MTTLWPFPTKQEESWRFSPIDAMAPLMQETGWMDYEPISSDVITSSSAGISGKGFTPVDRPSSIATNQATLRKIRLVGTSTKPVLIEFVGGGQPMLSHLVIDAEPNSETLIVLKHTGEATFIGNVDCQVGDGAKLTVVTLQEWANSALHAGLHQAVVGPNSHFQHIAVTLSGLVVRLQTKVSYRGFSGKAELFGLHVTTSPEHHEHRQVVDQNQPKTVSLVDYRGALQGRGASSVWVGDVLIRRDAWGVDSYEKNRNLLLTDGCIVHAVPNLEIETGQIVRAGHSSVTGRFDDEQLFYLESRGIPYPEARRLIVQGFFHEIIRRIGWPAEQARLVEAVDTKLADSIRSNHG